MNMIEITLKISPSTANYMLNALATAQMEIAGAMQQIKEQGDAQMQPPQPEPEVLDKE